MNWLRRSVRICCVGMLTFLIVRVANAQALPNECLQNFNVKRDAYIVHYGWLPGGSSFVNPMSCTSAELLREQLFDPKSGQALISADIESAVQEVDPLKNARQSLVSARETLANEKPNTLRLWFDAQFFAISKTQVLYSCLTIETGAGAGLCALGVIPLVVSGYDLWKKLEQVNGTDTDKVNLVAQINASISQIDRVLQSGQYKKLGYSAAATRLYQAQIGLCREVQDSCLGH